MMELAISEQQHEFEMRELQMNQEEERAKQMQAVQTKEINEKLAEVQEERERLEQVMLQESHFGGISTGKQYPKSRTPMAGSDHNSQKDLKYNKNLQKSMVMPKKSRPAAMTKFSKQSLKSQDEELSVRFDIDPQLEIQDLDFGNDEDLLQGIKNMSANPIGMIHKQKSKSPMNPDKRALSKGKNQFGIHHRKRSTLSTNAKINNSMNMPMQKGSLRIPKGSPGKDREKK